jgi:hypothetical protein
LHIHFEGYQSNRGGVRAEIAAAEAVLREQPAGSLRVLVDISQTEMMAEIAGFFSHYARCAESPIHSMAVVGVSFWQWIWYPLAKGVIWPKSAAFFPNAEQAGAWLRNGH